MTYSFEKQLDGLRKAGFTDEQVEAIWWLVTDVVISVVSGNHANEVTDNE